MDVVKRIHAGKTGKGGASSYLDGQILIEPIGILQARRERTAPSDQFDDLALDYWEFRAREYPHEASAAGDRRHDARLQGLAIADHARRAELVDGLLARASAIDADQLDRARRTSLELLIGQLQTHKEGWQLGDHLTPKLFPLAFSEMPAYILRATPLNIRADYQNLTARILAIAPYLQGGQETLQVAIAEGYRLPRVLVTRVRGLIEAQLASSGLRAIVLSRIATCPDTIREEDFAALSAEAEMALDQSALPAFAALLAWLNQHETELCRDTISICDQPKGKDYYRFKVRQQTTSDLDPDAIHAVGLEEVGRIRKDLDALLTDLGFGGNARDYADHRATRCIASDAESLANQARMTAKIIDAGLPKLFGRLPRITYGVQSFSVEQSEQLPIAMAQAAPADRSRSGVFWLTALPERCPTYLLPALCLHEAWPGHLMQFALSLEQEDLPMFRRNSSFDYNAYIEGWALYCELLGEPLGIYADPGARFGQLTFDLWRAARLVVDTGIHWKNWTRDDAIAYLEANSLLPSDTVAAEIDRYIGMPAQALSYKIGEIEIRGLRREAQSKLGEAFSIRGFHDAVLETGAVSLTVLRDHVRTWISDCAAVDAQSKAGRR